MPSINEVLGHGRDCHGQCGDAECDLEGGIMYHSGAEGHSCERKLIIDMPYIFEMVKQNSIPFHLNRNWTLREFNVTDIYFCLCHWYHQ